jgi:hypothetical protein
MVVVATWRDGRESSTMVVVVDRGLRVVYDAQIERRHLPTLNLGSTNRIPFRLLVRARYLYIYIPNSMIFLNTSMIGLHRTPTESNA